MNGISIALIIHSLDYYYKPKSAIPIDGLNSSEKILVRTLWLSTRTNQKSLRPPPAGISALLLH